MTGSSWGEFKWVIRKSMSYTKTKSAAKMLCRQSTVLLIPEQQVTERDSTINVYSAHPQNPASCCENSI